MGRNRRILVAALAAALVLPALAAEAGARGDGGLVTFRTPSRNLACAYMPRSSLGPAVLRCDVLSGLRPRPRAGCDLDWTGISLRRWGRARPTCAGDTVYDARSPILRYGRTWRRGGITCVSRRTGLRCSNRARRGFVLARERWRVF